jgi:hypothetical protein
MSRVSVIEVVLDQVVVAVPQADAVAAHAELEVLRAHLVVAHDVVVGLLEVDAEQAVGDVQVLDQVAVAADVQAGVVGVVRFARAGDGQVAQRGLVGLEDEDRALVAAVDDDLALAPRWSAASSGAPARSTCRPGP